MPRLFVSHAVKDKELVHNFVDFICYAVRLDPERDVFCSSLPGQGIPNGREFIRHIKSEMKDGDVVVFLVTENFLASQFCQNEIGAAWALDAESTVFVVAPVTYGDIRGVFANVQISNLADKYALNELAEKIVKHFGLPQFGMSHWERQRDKFLAGLGQSVPAKPSPRPSPQKPTAGAIDGSGSLLKLGNGYYTAEKVTRPDESTLVIELFSESAEQEAALESLRGRRGRGSRVPFAYQNDGGFLQINSVESTSHDGKHHWTIQAQRVETTRAYALGEMTYNGVTPDEIAEKRAGRLLVNDPPVPKRRRGGHRINDDMIEYAIVGDDDQAKMDRCVVREVLQEAANGDLSTAMRKARLEAVFMLKANDVVAHIFELAIGPVTDGTAHIRFRGKRRQRYANEEPEVIEIEADCRLE